MSTCCRYSIKGHQSQYGPSSGDHESQTNIAITTTTQLAWLKMLTLNVIWGFIDSYCVVILFWKWGSFGGKCNRNLKSVIECYKMHLWSHCKLHSLCLRTHALSLEYKPGILNIWFPSVHLWPENQRFSDIFQKREKWAFTVHPTTNHQKLLVQKTNGNFTSETNLQLSAIRSKFNSSWPTDQWWQTSMRPYHQWNQYVLPWLTQFL